MSFMIGKRTMSYQLRLFRDDRIADANGAAGDHLGIDTAVGVPEAAHQCLRNVEIARRGLWIDVDRRAADDPLDDPEPRIADGNGSVEQLEFVPGRPAADIEVGAEPQRVDREADHILDRGKAAEIDDGDHLPRDI